MAETSFLAQKICTLYLQFFNAFFASIPKDNLLKNILVYPFKQRIFILQLCFDKFSQLSGHTVRGLFKYECK